MRTFHVLNGYRKRHIERNQLFGFNNKFADQQQNQRHEFLCSTLAFYTQTMYIMYILLLYEDHLKKMSNNKTKIEKLGEILKWCYASGVFKWFAFCVHILVFWVKFLEFKLFSASEVHAHRSISFNYNAIYERTKYYLCIITVSISSSVQYAHTFCCENIVCVCVFVHRMKSVLRIWPK